MNSRLAPSRLAGPGALLLAVSFALTGCGQGSDQEAGAGSHTPIGARLIDLYSGDDNRELNHDRYENVVKACMEERGFEYSPEPFDQAGFEILAWATTSVDDPVADAEENGYWIMPTTKEALIERYRDFGRAPDDVAADEDLGSWPDDETTDDAGPWSDETADEDPSTWPDDETTDDAGPWSDETAGDDPSSWADSDVSGAGFTEEAFGSESNDAYYRSLSASERAAYDEALHGPDAENSTDSEYDWRTAGCHGRANHEVYQDRVPDLRAHLDSTVIDDFDIYAFDKISADPRQLEAEAAWVSCMADKGYDFAGPDDAGASIRQRFEALINGDYSVDSLERLPDEEITALHDDEIATASADARCIVDTGLEDVFDEVYGDAEAEFYDAHKAEVDAWFEAEEAMRR